MFSPLQFCYLDIQSRSSLSTFLNTWYIAQAKWYNSKLSLARSKNEYCLLMVHWIHFYLPLSNVQRQYGSSKASNASSMWGIWWLQLGGMKPKKRAASASNPWRPPGHWRLQFQAYAAASRRQLILNDLLKRRIALQVYKYGNTLLIWLEH